MKARRSAEKDHSCFLRMIPFLCDSTLMVRPEGAHSELSRKADLAAFLRSGLSRTTTHNPLRIGGFGALCNSETSLWGSENAKMEGNTRVSKRYLGLRQAYFFLVVWVGCCGEDFWLRICPKSLPQEKKDCGWRGRKWKWKSRSKVSALRQSKDILIYFWFKLI